MPTKKKVPHNTVHRVNRPKLPKVIKSQDRKPKPKSALKSGVNEMVKNKGFDKTLAQRRAAAKARESAKNKKLMAPGKKK